MKKEVKPVRNHKDRLFRVLFREKKELLSLYNAVNGTNYQDVEAMTITTLEHAIYIGMKNDISFILHDELMVYEHQSTNNPNIPLRDLFYVSSLYSALVQEEKLYSSRILKIPRPKFVVFYNGKEEMPERFEYKLSDAYIVVSRKEDLPGLRTPELELKVLVLNINEGCNEELKEKCKTLRGYMTFVTKVRRYSENLLVEEAVERAVDECIEEGVLADFFRKNRAEVLTVGIFECDEEKVMKVIREDGIEEGRAEGRVEGRVEGRKEGRAEGMIWGRIAGKAEAVLDLLEEIGDVPEELRSRIQKEQDVLKLKKWLKLAFEERTIEAFVEKM